MKAYDNKTALLKSVLKTVMDPPLVALKVFDKRPHSLNKEKHVSFHGFNYKGIFCEEGAGGLNM